MTTPSTKVSRLSEKQSTSRGRLDELLDSAPLCTVALGRDGHPVIFPTGFARVDDDLVIHGSTGSPWMRALAAGAQAAVAVTGLDGIVVARSGFESSLAATLPLRMAIGTDNWSLKISDRWPEDPDDDMAGDAWAGVVPMSVSYGAPLPAPDLRAGIPLPESVRTMTAHRRQASNGVRR